MFLSIIGFYCWLKNMHTRSERKSYAKQMSNLEKPWFVSLVWCIFSWLDHNMLIQSQCVMFIIAFIKCTGSLNVPTTKNSWGGRGESNARKNNITFWKLLKMCCKYAQSTWKEQLKMATLSIINAFQPQL